LSGTVSPDDLAPHLDDLLRVLALSRSDLAISKNYLPDPDRLAITRHLMSDPLSAESWLAGLAGDLELSEETQAIETAARLYGENLEADSVSGGGESVEFVTVLEEASSRVGNLLGVPPHSRDWLDLVHPDTSLLAPVQDGLLALGRSIPIVGLLEIVDKILMHGRIQSLFHGKGVGEAAVPTSYDSPFGRITIGSEQDDIYDQFHLLIIDPGGNDVYRGVAGVSSKDARVSVSIDFTGNDRYENACAAGRFGIGILIDLEGDDQYAGANGTQASGIGGVGVLIDRGGDDTYRAAIGAQGFGLYGAGVLIDRDGQDHYLCELLGQGAAGPGGVGLILDRSGDDSYKAGGQFRDFREEGAFVQSMSQGFSYGLQTEASAGAGVLVDLAGADRYEVGYFGQGASHWAGLGALYDRRGNDVYVARRYAQGCGLHLSIGILVDDSGNDVYSLWGVGQGTGHDLAVGVLSDREGDDRFEITWMGQGAGNGNGTGLMIDRAGDDVYSSKQADTQGYGGSSRGFGSVGLLMDLKGKDRFRSADERAIIVSGDTGARYDVSDVVGP
jgi:hypothetical protein